MQRLRTFLQYILQIIRRIVFLADTHRRESLVILGVFLVTFVSTYALYIRAPQNFPLQAIVHIPEGSTLSETAILLEEENVIRSSFWFKSLAYITFKQGSIFAGDYFLPTRRGVFSITHRVTTGDFDLKLMNITIHEGSTVREMAKVLKNVFPRFNDKGFIVLAEEREGYLFPDTYKFLPNVTPQQVVAVMEENFVEKIKTIQDKIDAFGRPLEEVIIMAALIEEEARTTESRRNVADVLWKRVDSGMLLQVDAVFSYINREHISRVTYDNLEVDSPYNTYLYKGLPIGPITNPGLHSILSTVTPISNNYYFYLSDREGNMHYATTFAGHKRNIAMYLR